MLPLIGGTVPSKRTLDVEFQADLEPSEIRFNPRFVLQ